VVRIGAVAVLDAEVVHDDAQPQSCEAGEDLGGADVHCRTSGVTDHLALDDRHALAITRRIVANFNAPSRADALVYEQTMRLRGQTDSVYFSFENIGNTAVFGVAFPTPNSSIPVKGSLPQTFLETTAKQAERAQSV
jgi:hypothetical protein